MKIRKLHLEQVGVFDSLTLEFPEKKEKDKAEIHILTGINGSGKSTILCSLASCFDLFPDNKILKKFKNQNSFVEIIADSNEIVKYSHKERNIKKSFFENMDLISSSEIYTGENKIFFGDIEHSDASNMFVYRNIIINYNPFDENSNYFDFAIFAYSSSRSLISIELDGIKELKINPFENSLSFDNTLNSEYFTQWIANNITRKALAIANNKDFEAKKYKKHIETIEKIVSEIVGFNIQFILEIELLRVKLKEKDKTLEFDVLPDGLKSIVSWIADLLMRMDRIKWIDDRDIFEREFILFLDEIDIHLHPAWQRKILPVIQKLFINAQIFVSTHSPFVVGSVSGAYVYTLDVKDGKGYLKNREESKAGFSYSYVLDEIFGIDKRFDIETERKFKEFYEIKNQILERKEIDKKRFLNIAEKLAQKSEQTRNIIGKELNQLHRITGEEFDL